MRRDMELIRALLLEIEGLPYDPSTNRFFKLAGVPSEVIAYHVHLLSQAGRPD
jgi:hypothetical protein